MRTLAFIGVLTSAPMLLASCSRPSPIDEKNAEINASVQKEKAERLAAQQLWSDLISKGQGCPGHILTGMELREAVADKRLTNIPDDAPIDRQKRYHMRDYYADGRLVSAIEFHNPFGRYWIEGEKLCHLNLFGMGEVKWCFRLIQRPDKQIMEEVIDDRDANDLRLACVKARLTGVGGAL